MAYERLHALVAPARAGAALWRTMLGVALSIAIYTWLVFLLLTVLRVAFAPDVGLQMMIELGRGDTPRGALLLLCSFVFVAAGPILLARPLHRRSWRGYFGPPRQALRDFARVLGALMILNAILWLVLPGETEMQPGLAFGTWMKLLPVTLVAVLLQTSSEELAFRGYLQGQLAARFDTPLVWMLLPATLFAFGHYAPEAMGENALLFSAVAFVFGLAAADLTARSGTLGAAIAFHFTNNVMAVALASMPGTLSGLALYLHPFPASDVEAVRPLAFVDLGAIGVSWLAARLALRL